MKRVMLDTNIYGELVKRGDALLVRRFVEHGLYRNMPVYGSEVIRKELRNFSLKTREAKKVRIAVLTLYDLLVRGHSFELTPQVYGLANDYVKVYKELKSQRRKKAFAEETLYNDFLIIASATIKSLDLVYSLDMKTMFSDEARRAYRIVNDLRKLRTPNFETYEGFIKEIRRWLP